MQEVHLDFETYYSTKTKFSLSSISAQDYVMDPRFEAIGVGIAIDDEEPVWYAGAQIVPALRAIDWGNSILATWNCAFDASILAWVYGLTPKALACPMSMARSAGWGIVAGGVSLAKAADAMRAAGIDVPRKGTEVVLADGKHLADFTPAELHAYGEYCRDDVRIARTAFRHLCQALPAQELRFQSMILKAFTEPMLTVDTALLREELVRVLGAKEVLLNAVQAQMMVGTREELTTVLNSSAKFAALLETFDVEVPMKNSKTAVEEDGVTPKRTYAFAKTDEEFIALGEHEDERVQALVAARLGTKSTIQESRINRMLEVAGRGPLPMAYNISGAHTHRLSAGGEKLNCQNMPSGRIKGQSTAMRRSLMAPPGYKVGAIDSAQIELRVGAYISHEQTALEIFRTGGDPYSTMASFIYPGTDPTVIKKGAKAGQEVEAKQRQIGKAAELGCQFGSGPAGFMNYCRTTAKVKVEEDFAKTIVRTWREARPHTVRMWRLLQDAMLEATNGAQTWVGGPSGRLLYIDGRREVLGQQVVGIQLPDGMWINYANLRAEKGPKGWQLVFDISKGRSLIPERTHGSKIFENVTQGTAFAAMKYQMNMLDRQYPVIGNVHDEGIFILPQNGIDAAKQYAMDCFTSVPTWLKGCPLGGEVGVADRYGDC